MPTAVFCVTAAITSASCLRDDSVHATLKRPSVLVPSLFPNFTDAYDCVTILVCLIVSVGFSERESVPVAVLREDSDVSRSRGKG